MDTPMIGETSGTYMVNFSIYLEQANHSTYTYFQVYSDFLAKGIEDFFDLLLLLLFFN